MNANFHFLCTLIIMHAYYMGNCQDFDFVIPTDTAQWLKNGKLLAKRRDGKLSILFEADETGAALAPLAGKKLRIGLKLLNPYFNNISDLNFDVRVSTPLYENATTANTLDGAKAMRLVGPIFSHALLSPARPVTVTLKDAEGQTVQTDAIIWGSNQDTISYRLSGRAPGSYTVEESYPDNIKTSNYYCDGEMQQLGIFGMIEIKIDSSFYANQPAFTIVFEAKKDILKYYVIVKHYQDAEFNQLSVTDDGYNTEARPEIKFTRVDSPAFAADDIPSAWLNGADSRVVLFKSQVAIPRQEKARSKIQLNKNSDALIKHLPQIGADRIDGNIIIHLSKP